MNTLSMIYTQIYTYIYGLDIHLIGVFVIYICFSYVHLITRSSEVINSFYWAYVMIESLNDIFLSSQMYKSMFLFV